MFLPRTNRCLGCGFLRTTDVIVFLSPFDLFQKCTIRTYVLVKYNKSYSLVNYLMIQCCQMKSVPQTTRQKNIKTVCVAWTKKNLDSLRMYPLFSSWLVFLITNFKHLINEKGNIYSDKQFCTSLYLRRHPGVHLHFWQMATNWFYLWNFTRIQKLFQCFKMPNSV